MCDLFTNDFNARIKCNILILTFFKRTSPILYKKKTSPQTLNTDNVPVKIFGPARDEQL